MLAAIQSILKGGFFMYRKMNILFIGVALLLFTASAQASLNFSYNLDHGTAANGGGDWWPYAEFNINFSDTFQGVTETFGYCAEFENTIYYESYEFEDREISGIGEYRAAWLMDKYAFRDSHYEGLSSSDGNKITALQASVWSLLGTTNEWAPINAPQDILDLYTVMMAEATDMDMEQLESLGLDLKYQILMPNIQLPERTEGNFQDLIVRTNAVPLPGAAMLLAPVLLGLVGIRRKLAA